MRIQIRKHETEELILGYSSDKLLHFGDLISFQNTGIFKVVDISKYYHNNISEQKIVIYIKNLGD